MIVAGAGTSAIALKLMHGFAGHELSFRPRRISSLTEAPAHPAHHEDKRLIEEHDRMGAGRDGLRKIRQCGVNAGPVRAGGRPRPSASGARRDGAG